MTTIDTYINQMSTNIKVQRICQYCGGDFTARTTTTRYCSHKCNSRDYKEKKKASKVNKSNSDTAKITTQPIEVVKAKEFLTAKEVALLLGCSLRTVYRLIDNGTIKAVNLGERMTRVKRADLNNIMEHPITLQYEPVEYDISECYTINEVQNKFGISETAVQDVIKRNNIPKTKKGKYAYVPKKIIDELLT